MPFKLFKKIKRLSIKNPKLIDIFFVQKQKSNRQTMPIAMLILFLLGYLFIALEHTLHINKTAISLLLGITLWTLYIFAPPTTITQNTPEAFQEFITTHPELSQFPLQEQAKHYVTDLKIIQHLGSIAEILFYLLGAIIVVETVDKYHGFDIITRKITTQSKRKLLWITSLTTFFMSSILDNMTSVIIMTLVIQKLITLPKERWLFCSMVIIAANAGGAWTPIGDVTTIMLWVNDNISSGNIMKSIFFPSLISLFIPLILTSLSLKGEQIPSEKTSSLPSPLDIPIKNNILIIGLFCLLAVPIFKTITALPPFAGIMLMLGIFWIYTDWITTHASRHSQTLITKLTAQTDLSTILFFLGILMAVTALESIGILHFLSIWLDQQVHNIYLINLIIGLLSAIIDNVPLVAAAIGMYTIPTSSLLEQNIDSHYLLNFVQDGNFWNLLAYCAGTGGSLLIIGSAAGVVVMGLEKINFIWYVKQISWRALLGFLCGIGIYYLQEMLLFL